MKSPTSEIISIIDEVLSNATFVASYSYDELIRCAQEQGVNGIGVFEEKDRKFFLMFEGGQPEGAIYVDPKGTLFGDKAAYLLSGKETFEFFQVSQPVVNALASRCRVFDKSHLKRRLMEEIPNFGGKKQSPGVLCLIIVRDGATLTGIRVSIKKGRQIIASDMTTSDGKVCFKLLNGKYDCTAVDREQGMYTFMVDFNHRYAETTIEIGG